MSPRQARSAHASKDGPIYRKRGARFSLGQHFALYAAQGPDFVVHLAAFGGVSVEVKVAEAVGHDGASVDPLGRQGNKPWTVVVSPGAISR